MKATLDSVFKILLGVELDGMCGTYEEGSRFSTAFDTASAITMYRYVDVFWKIKKFLNIGSEKVLRKCVKEVDEYVYKLIKTKIEQVHNSHDGDFPVSSKLIKSSVLVLILVLFL